MSLDKALKNLKFDVRMTEYNVNNSVITKEELKNHLTQLPDLAANSEQIDLDEGKKRAASADQLN